jgi:hypothetical protein
VTGPIDEYCEALRSRLHAKMLKSQADLERVRALLTDLEFARQAELVARVAEANPEATGPRVSAPKTSSRAIAQALLTAIQNLAELQGVGAPPVAATEPRPKAVSPRPPEPASTQSPPTPVCPWPLLLKGSESAPIVVVGGSSKPPKLDELLGPLGPRVDWIETSRQGTHAIGNLAQRIRQRRVSALIVLDAAVGHKHSDPIVSAAREVKIPTTYAHKGGATAVARAFTQLEKMLGAR